MSAELLRRAAVALRQHAEKASEGEWFAAVERGKIPVLGQVGGAIAVFGSAGKQAEENCRYAALVGPPVALALADLLDEALPYAGLREPEEYPIYVKAAAVARAVLRESTS